MRKPQEPEAPWAPWKSPLQAQVRHQVGPIEDEDADDGGDYDDPIYPVLSIEYIETWAKAQGISDPRTVKVQFYPGSHEMELFLEGTRVITAEMKREHARLFEAEVAHHKKVVMPAYEVEKLKYESDLRAYFKWQHDNVGG